MRRNLRVYGSRYYAIVLHGTQAVCENLLADSFKIAKEYMSKNGTQIMSWGPFAEGKNNYFTNPVLKEIGEKYKKSVAQVALRFLIQSNVVVIPKSTHKERMEENFNVFNFTLSADDMKKIEALDGGESLFFSHYDPKTVEWFMSIL